MALEKKESEMEKAIEGRVEARMRQREEEMAGLNAEWAAERQVPSAWHDSAHSYTVSYLLYFICFA